MHSLSGEVDFLRPGRMCSNTTEINSSGRVANLSEAVRPVGSVTTVPTSTVSLAPRVLWEAMASMFPNLLLTPDCTRSLQRRSDGQSTFVGKAACPILALSAPGGTPSRRGAPPSLSVGAFTTEVHVLSPSRRGQLGAPVVLLALPPEEDM